MKVEAARLDFVPRPILELAGALAVPLVLAPLPAGAIAVVVLARFGLSAAWPTFLLLAGLGFLTALFVAGTGFRDTLGSLRHVEIRSSADPPEVVFRSVRGTERRVRPADVQAVDVIEEVALGASVNTKIVFTLAGFGPLECPDVQGERAVVVTAWLSDRLSPFAVEVRHKAVLKERRVPVGNWYQLPRVAALWRVPPESVDDMAARLGVRTDVITPRRSEYTYGEPVQLYRPDDVYVDGHDLYFRRRAEVEAARAAVLGDDRPPPPWLDAYPDDSAEREATSDLIGIVIACYDQRIRAARDTDDQQHLGKLGAQAEECREDLERLAEASPVRAAAITAASTVRVYEAAREVIEVIAARHEKQMAAARREGDRQRHRELRARMAECEEDLKRLAEASPERAAAITADYTTRL
ncbi:hypothetical protein AB0J25_15625 [Streptomyces sp. NPDC049910]|uniref:hypothetical protein n=1 Tax=Streptomyces sp. NPDC049910 TaxID=3155278 RepID=UPI0034195BAC